MPARGQWFFRLCIIIDGKLLLVESNISYLCGMAMRQSMTGFASVINDVSVFVFSLHFGVDALMGVAP